MGGADAEGAGGAGVSESGDSTEHAGVEDESILTRQAAAPDEIVRYGTLPDQFAEVRHGAREAAASRPLLMLLHGGFWRPAYDLRHMSPLAVALAVEGWTTANVEYRRIPGKPQAGADDLQCAVRALPDTVSGHNGRVALIGFSAGGHWALWLAGKRAPVNAVVALAPVASLAIARELRLSRDAVGEFLGPEAECWRDWDPASLPSSPTPAVILHGDRDLIVPLQVTREYLKSHTSANLHLQAQVGHFSLIDPQSVVFPALLSGLLAAT